LELFVDVGAAWAHPMMLATSRREIMLKNNLLFTAYCLLDFDIRP
jgi:hypothetical protein